jgi:hypothetical protein
VEAHQDSLEQDAAFDLHGPPGTLQARKARPEDIDPQEVTEVFLSAAGFFALLVVAAVAAAVLFAVGAVRHW